MNIPLSPPLKDWNTPMSPSPQTFCGTFAIVGEPNVGKSTFINQWMNRPLMATSHKIHTTRQRLTGIVSWQQYQFLLVDTPGFISSAVACSPEKKRMSHHIALALQECDYVLCITDGTKPLVHTQRTLKTLSALTNKPLGLVINKVDAVPKPNLLPFIQALPKYLDHIFMVSALKNQGFQTLQHTLAQSLPAKKWRYDKKHYTTASMPFIASEMTRHYIFERLHKEIPYETYVTTDDIVKKKTRRIVYQTIWVSQDSHKTIVLGSKGHCIKYIGQHARLGLEQLWNGPVSLYLHVKVYTPQHQARLSTFHAVD